MYQCTISNMVVVRYLHIAGAKYNCYLFFGKMYMPVATESLKVSATLQQCQIKLHLVLKQIK